MPTPNRAGGVGRGQYGPSLKVWYQGPFFERDPAKTFRQNAREFIGAMMDDASQASIAAAPKRSGRYKRALEEQLAVRQRAVGGRKWALTGVFTSRFLKAPFPAARSGGGWFNYSGRVERKYHVFRKGKNRLYSARKRNRDLLRGIT